MRAGHSQGIGRGERHGYERPKHGDHAERRKPALEELVSHGTQIGTARPRRQPVQPKRPHDSLNLSRGERGFPAFLPRLPQDLHGRGEEDAGHSAGDNQIGPCAGATHTSRAAIITATLPMASFLEHSHTKRTFASKSTLGIDRPGTRRRLQHWSALRWPEFAEHRLRHGPVTAPKS